MGLGNDAEEERKIGVWNHLFPAERPAIRDVQVERDSPAWKVAWQALAQSLTRDGRSFTEESEKWTLRGSTIVGERMCHDFARPLNAIATESKAIVTDLKSIVHEQSIKPKRSQGLDL
jgi:hypothetical protein